MEPEFWQKRWQENQTGFHQSRVNSRLKHIWPTLAVAPNAAVFVPLCGKSLDMLWLHQQGHSVLGVELSEKAAREFFEENELPFTEGDSGEFREFIGTGQAAGIILLVGDFFALSADRCRGIQAFYDRAAMVAMPPEMRTEYAMHLGSLMAVDCVGMLLTMNYDTSKMNGPPFAVTDKNARELLDSAFTIEELAHSSGPEIVGNLAERGLDTMEERVYRLQRQAAEIRN